MSLREWLLFFHILAAVTWLGGVITTQIFAMRANRSNDVQDQIRFLRNTEFLGKFVFNFAGIAVFAFGLWLVIDSGVFGFDDWWVSLAMAVVIISAVLGMAFYSKEIPRLVAILEDAGPEDNIYKAGRRRMMQVFHAETIAILFVLWTMVFKPGS